MRVSVLAAAVATASAYITVRLKIAGSSSDGDDSSLSWRPRSSQRAAAPHCALFRTPARRNLLVTPNLFPHCAAPTTAML